MDDDVKNLFQKAGQATSSYQEINRDADSEQAKQRWPLLRDVRVHTQPDSASHERVQNIASVTSSVLVKNGAAGGKPFLKEFSGNPLFAQQKTPEGPLNVNRNTERDPVAQTQSTLPEQSVFAHSAKRTVANTPPGATMPETARLNLFGSAVSSDSLPDPVASSKLAPDAISQTVRTNSAPDKAKSVSDIFNRLARKSEVEKTPESSVNSFFKKIFRS